MILHEKRREQISSQPNFSLSWQELRVLLRRLKIFQIAFERCLNSEIRYVKGLVGLNRPIIGVGEFSMVAHR